MTTSVNINRVKESPLNPRKHFQGLDELADSIRSFGVLQPIFVRPVGNHFECVFGHRRLRAAKLAGLETIPAQVREIPDVDLVEVMLVENIQRADIHPLEEADTYKTILDADLMSVEDIALRVGKSKSHIYARLKLTELGESARTALLEGRLGLSVAMLLTRLDGSRQDEALQDLLDGEAATNTREAVWTLRRWTHDLRAAPFDTSDPSLTDEGPCSSCPKRSGNQKDLFGNIVGEHPEVCTDPACYEAKIEANWSRAKAKAEAKGLVVLESKEVFDKFGYTQAKYTESTALHPQSYKLPKQKTWKQLIGKALKPAVALNPRTGVVVEVYETKSARAALPEDVKAKLQSKTQAGSSGNRDDTSNNKEVKELVERRLIEAAANKAAEMSDVEVLRLAAIDIIECADGDEFSQALGWTDERNLVKAVAFARTATAEQLRALVVLQAVQPTQCAWGGSGKTASAIGIDVESIRKSVKAELAAANAKLKKKHKAKTEKTPTPGVCSTCGCTNQDGCEDGCSWVNKEHTLCSRCA